MTDPLRLLVLSDGRAGHDAQSLGLAEALTRRHPVEMQVAKITLPSWARALPPVAADMLGRAAPAWARTAVGGNITDFDIVLSTGRRAGLVAAALRRQSGARAVQMLDPKLGTNAYDLLILPDHDETRGPNVVTTLGALNRLTPQSVATAAESWADRLAPTDRPCLAVLIGGPSKSAVFSGDDCAALLQVLTDLAERHALIVTTSRRTPERLIAPLTSSLPETASVWTPEGENPYPAMLAHADAVLVTEDTVNMASEAATLGLPVHIFPITSVASKLAKFHTQLAEYGASRRFDGEIAQWSYPALNEADRIAEIVIERLVP